MTPGGRRVSVWVDAVIIVCMLPALSFPYLLASLPSGAGEVAETMLWIYPFYVLLAGWLARISWRERPYMTWILLVLMVLTHVCAWALVFYR